VAHARAEGYRAHQEAEGREGGDLGAWVAEQGHLLGKHSYDGVHFIFIPL